MPYSEDVKVIKSEEFALRIVRCYEHLTKREANREFVMSKQLLRSGTSIGANIAESLYAESHEDFIHKLAIAQKEASETLYWLKLLQRAHILESPIALSLTIDCKELLRLLSTIIRTMKGKKKS